MRLIPHLAVAALLAIPLLVAAPASATTCQLTVCASTEMLFYVHTSTQSYTYSATGTASTLVPVLGVVGQLSLSFEGSDSCIGEWSCGLRVDGTTHYLTPTCHTGQTTAIVYPVALFASEVKRMHCGDGDISIGDIPP